MVVDLVGAGLARIGADNRLSDGRYTTAQRWALAFHQHPNQPDGLRYRSRHDPSRIIVAMFDRVAPRLQASSLGALADPSNATILAEILDTYEFALLS